MTGPASEPRSASTPCRISLRLSLVTILLLGGARVGSAQWMSNLSNTSIDYDSVLENSYVRWNSGLLIGEQPGYAPGYYRFGAFANLLESDDSLLFLDAHGIVNTDNGAWSSEVGIGHRAYDENSGAVIGANAYYNHRDYTSGPFDHSFHAYGFGVEYLTCSWALRQCLSECQRPQDEWHQHPVCCPDVCGQQHPPGIAVREL